MNSRGYISCTSIYTDGVVGCCAQFSSNFRDCPIFMRSLETTFMPDMRDGHTDGIIE